MNGKSRDRFHHKLNIPTRDEIKLLFFPASETHPHQPIPCSKVMGVSLGQSGFQRSPFCRACWLRHFTWSTHVEVHQTHVKLLQRRDGTEGWWSGQAREELRHRRGLVDSCHPARNFDWDPGNDGLLDNQLWSSWDTGGCCKRILLPLWLEGAILSRLVLLQRPFGCPEGLTELCGRREQYSGRFCYHISAVPAE